jgi:hypothetical protein
MPLDRIGFKRVGYTVSAHMGLNIAEPDTSPSYLRYLVAKNIIDFSDAKDQDQVRAFVETSFTIGNPYALGRRMTV